MIFYKPFSEKKLLQLLTNFGNKKVDNSFQQVEAIEIENSEKNNINISHLTELANGDEIFKKEMINIFIKSIKDGTIQIENYCNEQQWIKASDIAHKIMPPCKHFEANELYNVLQFFENMINQSPDIEMIVFKIKKLKRNVEIVDNELKLYV